MASLEHGEGYDYSEWDGYDMSEIKYSYKHYTDAEVYRGTVPDVLPDELGYVEINRGVLRAYLDGRNSILADEPYFSAIINVAKEYGINPLLMFAITGQEQGFVPRNSKYARKIANNPFNVYHSWYEYNTNIYDSARIAARTVLRLSKNRPEAVHPIYWINKRGYAEDRRWWVGVTRIYETLKRVCAGDA
jgi:hypothetical protein